MPAPATPFEALQDLAYIFNHKECTVDPKAIIAPTDGKIDIRYFNGYKILISQNLTDEVDFAKKLGFVDNKDKNYRRYRSELITRMLNLQLFVENGLDDNNHQMTGLQKATKFWAIAKSLRLMDANNAFLYCAQQSLDICEKFEIPSVALEILRELILMAALRPELKSEFDEWLVKFDQYSKAHDAEIKVSKLWATYLAANNTKKGANKNLIKNIDALYNEIINVVESNDYFFIQNFGRRIKIARYEARHDWENLAVEAEGAINFFNNKPYHLTSTLTNFACYLIVSYAMAGNHERAKLVADQYLDLSSQGTLNWFKNRELLCFSSLWVGEYKAAYDLTQTSVRHARYKFLPTIDQETWRLYQGYLLWLYKLGKLDLGEKEQADMKRMRASAIFNDMSIYSKDKQGGNIPVLVLQTLFLLIEGKWDEFDSKAEALRKYRERNLSEGEDETRSDVFIKMIGLVSKLNNDLSELKDKVIPLIAQLNNPQTPMLGPSFEVEPVKYTRVWDYAMEVLESGEFVQ